MQKKKIVIIGPAYPYRGGNSLYVSYVYESLSADYEVKLFNYKLLYPSLLFPGTTQYDESNKILKQVPNERLINSINPLNWIYAANRIIKENADLIIFDWWQPFFGPCHFAISSMIKKKYKSRILFITENYVSHEGRFVDKFLTKLGLANASSFIALSGIVENDLKNSAGTRRIYRSELPVFEYYTGNDLTDSRTKLNYKPEDKVLLFFGYIRKYKGLDTLIEAFPGILEKIPEAKLLIVGESYDDPEFYDEKIRQLGITNKTVFINKFIPNEKVGDYYYAADLVILPYRSATQSGILNIAYGFNKPVLVTNVGGLAELVDEGKTGLVVEPDSTEALIKGVTDFFELRKSVNFEKNIKARVSGNVFSRLPSLINKIIEESR